MKSVKRLSKYTSILLSMLLMLSAMSPGLTALAQEKANAAPAVLTYEDDSITAELKATEGTSLPAGAALNVKALNKDSQDEAEKALYAQTEAGLNAKASEQRTSIDGFTAYSITLTQNGQDVTPEEGAFKLKLTDKNAAAPEAYKQSQDGQKSVELYQETEAKDEQNNPVSTMEPKQEDAASINTDLDGNVTGVETALTTLKPVAVTWQNPQQQAMEEENAPSVQSEEEQSNALAASYSPNNPGPLKTVETIDSASMGVDIQMFDYERSLPDYNNWGKGQNGMLFQGLVDKELHKNKYVDEYYPETTEQDQYGTSLFDNFVTKNWKGTANNQNYLGKANHLFREDVYTGTVPKIGSAGTFYYSSFDNYAYWPKGAEENVVSDEDGTYPFKVYQQIGTPKLGSSSELFYYQRGNFMPYNPIKDGEFADNTLNLYDENGKVLNQDDARYKEKLYKTQQPEWSRYPLQDGNDYTENNYYFGMVVTANFIQQKNGKYNGQDMVYKFNGDDDMWVFIDGVLVLDLGGVRDAQSGEINFSTGEVKWTNYNSTHTINEGNLGEGCKDFTKTIKDQFKDTSKENITEWNNNGEGATFADYTGHEIKIFYMERGAGASNCKMQFNLPTVPKDSISVTKEVTNVNEGAYTDVDFNFKLYIEQNARESTDGKETIKQDGKTYVLATDQPYDLKEGTEIVPGTEGSKTNDNGIFTLKHGQTAYFKEIAEQGTKYIVQEVGVDQNQYDTFKVNGEAVSASGSSISGTTNDGKIVQTKPLTVGTDAVVKMQNHCDGENHHTINITKQIDGGQASDDNFTAQVTIGGKPYTGKYKVAAKNATEKQWESAKEQTTENGSVQLKASQTIRIENIAAGTRFEVTETGYNETNYKTPTYTVEPNSATEIRTDQSKASGKVEFGKNPQITITNHLNFSEKDFELNKTATVDSWDDRTYDIRLEASSNLKETVTSNTPYDIVLVLDSSESMNNKLTGHTLYNDGAVTMNNSYYYKTDSGIFQLMDRVADKKNEVDYYKYNDAVSGKEMRVEVTKKKFDLTEAQKGRIYKKGSTSDTKQQALEEAAASFLDAVNTKSPDSRVGVVTFGDNSQIKTTKDGKTLLKVGTDGSLDQLKKWTAITPAGATAADEGMASAERVFDETDQWQDVEQKENREKLVVFFTDGVPTKNSNMFSTNVANAAVESAQSIKQNATIYSIGIFEDANSNGYFKNNERAGTIKKVDTYMKGIASPNCYMTTDNMEELKSLFGEIAENMGKAIKGATITDVIDSRFELTKESREALESAGAVITSGNDGTTTITWTNQTINAKTASGKAGWAADIKVVAKEDYIGGNNVSTNVAGISNVTVNGITKPFDQPVVNVKADISLLDQANTIFWDETVPASGALIDRVKDLQTLIDKNVKDYKVSENSLKIEWTNENGVSYSIEAMTKDKPEKDTYYTVNVSYDAGAPSDDGKSTENTDGHKNGDESNTITAQGKYDVHVVKGQLEITKTIDEPYTNIEQINANQTFVFKIERREEKDGDVKETFYETINFDANDTNTNAKTKSKLVSGLKKGYYTVTEETNWSQKYELKKTEDNYDKNNKAAVDLLIGDRLKEATQDNPKPEFYGLDETKLKNNSGEELPADQQYRNFAEGSKATVEFTNKLNTNWKWLSDTAAAVNVFDGHAQ